MNYVPKDEQSSRESGKYDLILCLSVTKWIHLNYGDHGVKLTFKKIFSQLRPGGKFILELQNWPSYKKKKKMTAQIHENYKNINFSPSNFADYLLSQEVGFSHYYTLGVTQHLSKGFRRPIYLFVKGEFTPREGNFRFPVEAFADFPIFQPTSGATCISPPRRLTAARWFTTHKIS